MDFAFREMGEVEARLVAAWKYPPPYDFYDMTADEEDLEAWLADGGQEGRYSAFCGDDDLVGFFSFGADARVSGGDYSGEALDVGLGLRPDLTGRGLGVPFVEAGLLFARERFAPERFRLSVARFNERAIRVYRRVGFGETGRFVRRTNGGEHAFVLMERSA